MLTLTQTEEPTGQKVSQESVRYQLTPEQEERAAHWLTHVERENVARRDKNDRADGDKKKDPVNAGSYSFCGGRRSGRGVALHESRNN